MLVCASERTQWNIKMRLLQAMTAEEYCNVYGECVDITMRVE